MNINIFRRRAMAAGIALLLLICGTSSRGWCGDTTLWISYYGGLIQSFSSKQLKKSGMPTPVNLDTGGIGGIAFDKSNNLWINTGDTLARITPKQLKKLKTHPSPTPGVVITSSTFNTPLGCAFDHQGNLWVTDSGAASIDEISKAQLDAGSGAVTPAVVITSSDLDVNQFLTFDAAGNAWVESEDNDEIVEFSASQLSSGGSKTPVVVLSNDGSGSLDEPGQLAFDKNGNLWVPNYANSTVVEFAHSQLASSGDPTPTVTLNSAGVNGPWALTFDSKGDLVVVSYSDGIASKFTAKQIEVSGAPTPAVSITNSTAGNGQITFGPGS